MAPPRFGHTDTIISIALSKDGNTMVSGSSDYTIIVWQKDTTTNQWNITQTLGQVRNENPTVGHKGMINSLVLSTDGQTIVSSSNDHTIIVWKKDTATGQWQMIQRLGQLASDYIDHFGGINSVALSVDGKTIVGGSDDHTVTVWQKDDATDQWQLTQTLGQVYNQPQNPTVDHTSLVSSVALSKDGKTIVSGSWDNTIIVWQKDEAAGQWIFKQRLGQIYNQDPTIGHTNQISSIALSEDGKTIISGSWDHTIIAWQKDEATGQWIFKQRLGQIHNQDPTIGHTNQISSIALSKNGKDIVSSSNHTIIVWQKDEATGQWIFKQRLGQINNRNPAIGHTNRIKSICLSEDGKTMVSGSSDNTIIVWQKEPVEEYCARMTERKRKDME